MKPRHESDQRGLFLLPTSYPTTQGERIRKHTTDDELGAIYDLLGSVHDLLGSVRSVIARQVVLRVIPPTKWDN
jgi:hypothetical protein